MDITSVSFVTLEGLKEFLAKCKETFALKSEIPKEYELPIAGETTLGGVKIGENLSITSDGVLSATGGGSSSGNVDSLLFQKEYHSEISQISNFPAYAGSVDLYFPNVTDITSNAMQGIQSSNNGYPTLHFSVTNRAAIKKLDGYPKFGSNYSDKITYLFDIGAVKMTVNKGSANIVYIDGESVSGDTVYIVPSTDTPVIACDGVGLLIDTVNKAADFTYDVVIPSSGTAVGLNFVDAADDATANAVYTYENIKIATLSGKSTSILCPDGTKLSASATVISGGTPYTYDGIINSFADVYLADCTKATNYLTYANGSIIVKTEKEAETIGNYAYNKQDVAAVHFEACTSVGSYAFEGCSALTSIDLPACTSVGSYAFQSCGQLTSIDLPACTSVGSYAFWECSQLTSIDLPACTSVGSYAFEGCSQLTSINLLACTSVGSYAFSSCSSLASINLPACTDIQYSFSGCTNLKEIHFAAANQSYIEALTNYSNKFGADSATIYFDL